MAGKFETKKGKGGFRFNLIAPVSAIAQPLVRSIN
jgi:uncharacterized protein YegP (UPF0339 family)